MSLISEAEHAYVVEGMERGVRNDGRKPLQYRELAVQTGILAQASGSASCQLGNTEVLVAVKADIGVPFPETPDQGGLEVSVEISPCTSQGYALEARGVELAKALQRSLKWEETGTGAAINLEALKVVSGKRCWVLMVDGLVLSADGNLLDALSMAVRAALADLRIPHIDVTMGEGGEDPELDLDEDPERAIALDTSLIPLLVTVTQAGGALAVDLTEEEEAACGNASIQVAVSAQGKMCGLSKRGGLSLGSEKLLAMVETAQLVGMQLQKAMNARLQKGGLLR